MAYLLGVLVMAVGLAASIALHEVGHLVPAKRFGVKCTQYMVGFGPTLWSRRVGETEYGVKAIPLGGYVRMVGMFPPMPGRRARADSTGRWSLMIEQARRDAHREVGPQDSSRLFYQRSVPKRLVIMLGGPVMNLLIAIVLITILLMGQGVPQVSTRVEEVSKCVLPATAPAAAQCTATSTPAPAAVAGLLPGDTIVTFAGRRVNSWDDVRSLIRSNGDITVPMTVKRDGRLLELRVEPIKTPRKVLDANGNTTYDAAGNVVLEQVGFIGVTPSTEFVRQPLSAVPPAVWQALTGTAGVVLSIPERMVGVAKAAFGNGPRDPSGPIGLLGIGRIAGEVASAKPAAAVTVTWVDRLFGLLQLLASLNLALFVFNLIPLLPLDGGHVAGALWEGLRRRVARLRRRPDPGPVDIARALPLAYGVASVLIGMSVLLIYADIVRPVKLGG